MKKNKAIGQRFYSIVFIFGLVLFIALNMYQNFKVDILMKELSGLHEQRRVLLNETEKLRIVVDRLSDIDRITRLASEQHQLINSAEEIQLLTIAPNQKIKDPEQTLTASGRKKTRKIKMAGVQ